ncbi:NAD-dependent epimerase/dehydratase family protein [Saccharopolyspora mangrovi]|uniref:NAD-dependent epimerase/dehydratase family protein n=1 Tax=Saccharopolyspora mangrovi TaxID=3082379 RepID=A0ABU6ACA0_9PSEU|nr:NAD-dependent epimerase/dehydratase family protein [Saccharopolyspora sp. S2-29]MEB3369187.1 NAD-dependent epimerase/dehydratase family protein [Saccharopolyspora sp. S2-29]
MRFLVTGGAGFIGSHLTEYLLRIGNEVLVLDDLSTGAQRNLEFASEEPGLQIAEGSVLDSELVNRCASGVDGIFHLAAAVGTFTISQKTLESLQTNIHGTETVLDAACRHQRPVLVASTSEVYGRNTKIGLTEDDDLVLGTPLHSRWSYAEAKALDETLAYAHAAEHGLRAVIARLFNTVGPGQNSRYGMVIPRFVEQALAGEALTVFGDGQQIRCFCHVHDVVPALVALLRDGRAYGQVFNVGSSEQVTIEELARRVIAITGSSSDITHVPYEDVFGPGYQDTLRRVPDCGKVRAQIGFSPERNLDQIIESVAAQARAAPKPALKSGG